MTTMTEDYHATGNGAEADLGGDGGVIWTIFVDRQVLAKNREKW